MINPSLHSSNFDFSKYKTLSEKIMAAKAALRKTVYGLGQVIEVVPDGQNVKFVISGTGEEFPSMAAAIGRASMLFATQTLNVSDPYIINKVSGVGAVLKDITSKKFSKDQIAMLEAAGIDTGNISNLKMNIQILSGGKGDAGRIVNRIKTLRERREFFGTAIMDDKGARVISMRMGDKQLTGFQVNLLLSASGHSRSDFDTLSDAVQNMGNKSLGESLIKLSKRERTLLSEREVALAGKDLTNVLGGGKSLKDSAFFSDFQYQLMRKYAYEQVNKGKKYKFGASVLNKNNEKSLRLQAAYKHIDVDSYMGSYLGQLTTDERTTLFNLINNYTGKKDNFKNLSDYVKIELEKSKIPKKSKDNILLQLKEAGDSAARAVDGSALLNTRVIKGFRIQLRLEQRRLMEIVNDPKATQDAVEEAKIKLNNLKNVRNQISGSNLDDIIGRGHIPGLGDIKTSFTVTNDIFSAKIEKVETVGETIKILKKEIKRLEKFEKGNTLYSSQKQALYQYRNSLKRLTGITDEDKAEKIIRSLDTPLQLGSYGKIRTIREISPLSRMSMIINTDDIKKESGFSGRVEQLLLSGFGHPRDEVFLDPISGAAHPDIFTDPKTIEAMQKRGYSIIQKLEETLAGNILPQDLKKRLTMMSQENIENLPNELRLSRLRAKELAQSILELHASGIGPMESPKMMNMLVKMHMTEAFRERDGLYLPVIPDAMRFSVSTEARLGTSDLDKGFKQMFTEYIDEAGKTQRLSENVVHFRVKDHTMYFGGETVGKIKDALGGFDLDDKGIIKMMSYQDDKGRSRILFNMIRQPTALEERLFARAYYDKDTLTGMFKGQDYFKKAVEDYLIGATSKVGVTSQDFLDNNVVYRGKRISAKEAQYRTISALQKVIYEKASMEEAFSDIGFLSVQRGRKVLKPGKVYPSQLITGRELSRRRSSMIESAIEAVYRQMENMGTTTVVQMTNADKQRLAKFGFASLATNTPGASPVYREPGVFKVFTESKAFDMRQEINEALNSQEISNFLRKYKHGSAFRQEIEAASKKGFQEVMQVFTKKQYEPLSAIFADAFERKQMKAISDSGDSILGVYANRSTAIASTLNQYKAFINKANDDTLTKYLLKNFQIGMLAAEDVIDLSVNPAGIERIINMSQTLQQSIVNQIGDAPYLNKKGVDRAVAELLGYQNKLGKITVEQIGAIGIENLGKTIGASRVYATMRAMGEDYMMGIDIATFTQRVKGRDQEKLLKGIIEGMTHAQAHFKTTELADLSSDMQQALKTQDPIAIERALQPFLLKHTHKFANLAKAANVGLELYGVSESIRRANVARMEEIGIRSAVTSEQSDRLVQSLIAKNRESLDFIFSTNQEERKEFSELQKANFYARSAYLEEDILRQIDDSSRLQGISIEELVNSFDKMMIGGGRIDIGALETVTQDPRLQELHDKIQKARTLRTVKRFEQFDQDLANELRSNIIDQIKKRTGSAISPTTYEEFKKALQEQLSFERKSIQQTTGQNLDDILELTKRALLAEDLTGGNPMLAAEAQTQAQIIQSQFTRQEHAQDFIDIEQKGIINNLDDLSAQIGDDASIDDDILRSVLDPDTEDVITKASYKRISEKIKTGDFKKLFSEPMVRNSVLAAGALVVGSLAYSSYRDRTHEDIAGPPLLPGGSAYETNYPVRVPQMPDMTSGGYMQGNSYSINVSGSPEKIEQFNALASRLSNDRIRTTIFNRIANVAEDPFGSIASSY